MPAGLKTFGKVTVTTGGTPARATANQTDPAAKVHVQSLMFQALPGNTGKVYVMVSEASPGDLRSTLTKCAAILAVPTANTLPSASFSIPSEKVYGFNVAEWWLDVDVNGEGAIITGTRHPALPIS